MNIAATNIQETQPVTGLIEDFKEFYRDFGGVDLRSMSRIYADGVRFKDPIHEVKGLPDLHAYLESVGTNVEFCRFEYLDQLVCNEKAYIKWNMNFRHPRLCQKTLSVRGMSHIEFSDRIYYHEDVYDLGQMLYEHLPLLGIMTRLVKRRLKSR